MVGPSPFTLLRTQMLRCAMFREVRLLAPHFGLHAEFGDEVVLAAEEAQRTGHTALVWDTARCVCASV